MSQINQFEGMTLDSANAELLSSILLAETPMAAGHLLQQATFYLQIQAMGAIPFMIFTSTVFILRVEGKANYSILFSLVALITNIGLDFLFVNVMGGNMVGAVIATVIAQALASYLAIRIMRSKLKNGPTKLD
jgi:Na+-driven multidrug efflux pump